MELFLCFTISHQRASWVRQVLLATWNQTAHAQVCLSNAAQPVVHVPGTPKAKLPKAVPGGAVALAFAPLVRVLYGHGNELPPRTMPGPTGPSPGPNSYLWQAQELRGLRLRH